MKMVFDFSAEDIRIVLREHLKEKHSVPFKQLYKTGVGNVWTGEAQFSVVLDGETYPDVEVIARIEI